MTKREMTFGWGWLAVQMLVLPSLISSIAAPWGSAAVNFCYHLVSLLAVTVIFHRYLKQELRNFTAGFKKVLPVIAVSLAVYYVAGEVLLCYVAGEVLLCLITAIDPGFRNVNDDSVAVLRQGNLALTAVMTVALAPVSEECLFRGLIFGCARKHSRWAAYDVSAVAFGALHVMGYVGSFGAVQLFLCFAQYLPAGLVLAAAMEKTDSIVTAMCIHAIINAVSMIGIL